MRIVAFFALFIAASAWRLCHHNDFHARYEEISNLDSPCSPEDAEAGLCFSSIARVKAAMDMLQCDLRVSAGDYVQGSVYDSIFGVEIAIDSYNAVGYDIAVLGNHEFNNGPEPIYETVMKTPHTTWLTTNVFFSDSPAGFKTNRTVECFDTCFVNALTPTTLNISLPGPTVNITDPAKTINMTLSHCSSTDNVIAVTHIGYQRDIQLCNDVPELDLVIGGHSHTDLAQGLYPTKVEREDGSVCWVVQARSFGRYLGAMDISFDEGEVQLSGLFYLPLDARVPKDPTVQSLIDTYTERLEASVKQVIGNAVEPIDGSRENCRTTECEMGNLACDAILAYAGPQQGAVACLTNGGGLRASIDQGPITIEEVLNVLPFGNVHAVITLPGSGLKDALENGFLAIGNDEINGRFLQVSGMVVEADFSAPAGERLVSVKIGGEEVVDDTLYTIATNSFIASGGDGFEWVGSTEIELSGRGLDTLVSEYLEANDPYTAVLEGRIVDVPA